MRIDVGQHAGTGICAGALSGRELLIRLLEETKDEPSKPEVLLLDFGRVEVATVSFLRESIFSLRAALRARRSLFKPVLVNVNPTVAEELSEAAEAKGEHLPTAKVGDNEKLTNLSVYGRLDPKFRRILDYAVERGSVTASGLHEQFGTAEAVKQTAWNNRLAALADTGLLIESPRGRAKVYHPLTEVI